jgi:hypothetical protein
VIALAWCTACAGRELTTRATPLPVVLRQVGEAAIPELRRAWMMCHAGAAAAEEAVVVTRLAGGGYQAVVQPHGNLHGSARFVLPPDAVAVFHTHSDRVLPQPSRGDRRLADRTGVPILTLSREGIFLYDPESERTWKLMERLEWLEKEAWRGLAVSREP